jgi:PAS domain S-box-containing protein
MSEIAARNISQKKNITDRKRVEAALKEKIEELRRMATVVSDSNDAVIMHDFDGKILAWNRGAKETYGYTEAEALKMNVRDIVAEADREAALNLIQRIRQGDIVKSFELRRVTKDGRVLDVWLTTTLLTDEKGKPVAIATTERDITERKRAEDTMKEQLEELRRWQEVTLGRETRILDLKREVNELLAEKNRPSRYSSVEPDKNAVTDHG